MGWDKSKFAISVGVIVVVRAYFLVCVMSLAASDCSVVVNVGYFIYDISTVVVVIARPADWPHPWYFWILNTGVPFILALVLILIVLIVNAIQLYSWPFGLKYLWSILTIWFNCILRSHAMICTVIPIMLLSLICPF